MPILNLILGDQLFEDVSDLPNAPILMVEDRELARHSRYHTQKLVLTLSAMRHFANRMGDRVHYYRLDQDRRFFEVLESEVKQQRITEIHTFEPADSFFRSALIDFASQTDIQLVLHRNPMFLTSSDEWEAYTAKFRRRLMAEFYVWQRRRLGILVTENGDPIGGRWSFDEENRLRLPSKFHLPYVGPCIQDDVTKEVIEIVSREFSDHPGTPEGFGYPVTHEQALAWLETFVEERLDQFGPYEDAVSQNERVIFHSLLSPMMNIGLLTPKLILARVFERHRERPIPMNSLEGFVRQVIGWREFVRGIDRDYEAMSLPKGPFHHTRRLKPCWYGAKTGLPPLDAAIRRAKDHAYCHHIERLMVIGASMFMCELDPLQVNDWFMEMFIDAADWVMRPNVIGMSQFADGGYFATKPYLSGSSYILKMSDYSKGPWCDVWDGLYWRLIDRNRDFFMKNPRLSVMAKGVDRLETARKERIFHAAEKFIEETTTHA